MIENGWQALQNVLQVRPEVTLAQITAALAGPLRATGAALNPAQTAQALRQGGPFAWRVAELVNKYGLQGLAGTSRGAAARALTAGARQAIIQATAEGAAGAVTTAGGAGASAAATGTGMAGGAATAGAGTAGGVGLLGWIAAHPLLFTALLVGAGLLTAGVARVAGTLAADAPSAVAGSGPSEIPANSQPSRAIKGGGYLPVAVYIQGKPAIVSVRSVDAIKQGIAQSNFRHGGINGSITADVRILSGSPQRPFQNAKDATTALCRMLTGPLRKPPLAAGWIAQMNGGRVTVDDFGNVDLSVCRNELRP